MNSLHAQELQEILLRYPFQSLVVPCPCRSGHPYLAAPDSWRMGRSSAKESGW